MSRSEQSTLYKRGRHNRLRAAYEGFLLAKEAERCTLKTLGQYQYSVGGFVLFLERLKLHEPRQITRQHIHRYKLALRDRGLKHSTQKAHANDIRKWLHWLALQNVQSAVDLLGVAAELDECCDPLGISESLGHPQFAST